jgi:hypothetical protein
MTQFVHVDYPTEHAGVVRAEAAYARGQALLAGTSNAWGALKNSFTSGRGLTLVVLAAVVALMVLVADRLVDTWADEHLFAAWVALWTLIFATLAVFAPVAKSVIDAGLKELGAWRERSAAAHAEAAFLDTAQRDPRVMAELRAAISRHEAAQVEAFGEVQPNAVLDRMMNTLPASKRYLRYV